jgi:hypothetical protein
VENFDVFDFDLTTDQLDALDALDKACAAAPNPKRSPSKRSGATFPKPELASPEQRPVCPDTAQTGGHRELRARRVRRSGRPVVGLDER